MLVDCLCLWSLHFRSLFTRATVACFSKYVCSRLFFYFTQPFFLLFQRLQSIYAWNRFNENLMTIYIKKNDPLDESCILSATFGFPLVSHSKPKHPFYRKNIAYFGHRFFTQNLCKRKFGFEGWNCEMHNFQMYYLYDLSVDFRTAIFCFWSKFQSVPGQHQRHWTKAISLIKDDYYLPLVIALYWWNANPSKNPNMKSTRVSVNGCRADTCTNGKTFMCFLNCVHTFLRQHTHT